MANPNNPDNEPDDDEDEEDVNAGIPGYTPITNNIEPAYIQAVTERNTEALKNFVRVATGFEEDEMNIYCDTPEKLMEMVQTIRQTRTSSFSVLENAAKNPVAGALTPETPVEDATPVDGYSLDDEEQDYLATLDANEIKAKKGKKPVIVPKVTVDDLLGDGPDNFDDLDLENLDPALFEGLEDIELGDDADGPATDETED